MANAYYLNVLFNGDLYEVLVGSDNHIRRITYFSSKTGRNFQMRYSDLRPEVQKEVIKEYKKVNNGDNFEE